jgi:hypothetical protein
MTMPIHATVDRRSLRMNQTTLQRMPMMKLMIVQRMEKKSAMDRIPKTMRG